MGGPNKTPLINDHGPWNDFEIVDGCKKGDVVGVRKKSDGPGARIFTLNDFESLPNRLLVDPNKSAEHFKKNKGPLKEKFETKINSEFKNKYSKSPEKNQSTNFSSSSGHSGQENVINDQKLDQHTDGPFWG